MSFEKLDPAIWMHILDFLHPPIPKPRAGLTKQEAVAEPADLLERLPDEHELGVTRRKDIRCDALSKLMRTSIASNQLGGLPLYSHIVTDRFVDLLHNLNVPSAHPHISSKADLLSLTKRLHLEYKQKGTDGGASAMPEPAYMDIMAHSKGWETVDPSPIQRKAWSLGAATDEMCDIHNASPRYSLWKRVAFPALTHLTTGMVFGGQRSLWNEVLTNWKRAESSNPIQIQEILDRCKASMVEAFQRSPIVYFCQRGDIGPLSLPSPTFSWRKPSHPASSFPSPNPVFNIHYSDYPGNRRMSAADGFPTRWLLDYRPPFDNDQVNAVVGRAVKCIRDIVHHDPKPAASGGLLGRGRKNGAIDVTIYAGSSGRPPAAPASQPLDWHHEREILTGMSVRIAQSMRDRERESGKPAPQLVWRHSTLSPPCHACGWVYEDE